MSDIDTTRAQRIRGLLEEYRQYIRKHGAQVDGGTDIAESLKMIRGRRSRVAALESQILEIRKEIRWIEAEIDGREAAIEATLRELLGRWERMVLDGWLPTPILGYRMWAIEPDGLRGVRVGWRTRKLTARCDKSLGSGRVPHSDGRCGRLGCGIYVAKDLPSLLDSFLLRFGMRYVVGVTALSGKVVEHDRGYRGEHGELVAAVAVLGNDMLATADPGLIDGLCAAPAEVMAKHGTQLRGSVRREIEDFLIPYVERTSTWTSDVSDA